MLTNFQIQCSPSDDAADADEESLPPLVKRDDSTATGSSSGRGRSSNSRSSNSRSSNSRISQSHGRSSSSTIVVTTVLKPARNGSNGISRGQMRGIT